MCGSWIVLETHGPAESVTGDSCRVGSAGQCPYAAASSGELGFPPKGKKGGVHNVHTLGVGLGRTGAGLGRIAEVFGGVAEIQGLGPGSSPTSGTVFSLFRGLWASE